MNTPDSPPSVEDTALRRVAPITFVNRIEKLLMIFLKEFFSQERLIAHTANKLRYDGLSSKGSLFIQMTEDRGVESTNALPAIVIQDGGWEEVTSGMDNRHTHEMGGEIVHKTIFMSAYTIHCVGRNRGEAKLLQALVGGSIFMFRRALYGMGMDFLTNMSGMAPQKLSAPESDGGPYDAAVMFAVRHSLDWGETWGEEFEEKISISVLRTLESTLDGDEGVTSGYEVDLTDTEEP